MDKKSRAHYIFDLFFISCNVIYASIQFNIMTLYCVKLLFQIITITKRATNYYIQHELQIIITHFLLTTSILLIALITNNDVWGTLLVVDNLS